MSEQELILGIFHSHLLQIANAEDCHYLNESDRPFPCDCSVCVAKRALEVGRGWRYRCSGEDRLERSPRERSLVDAWRQFVDGDRVLSQILHEEGGAPSIRDWYVATSVVRWLGTNCGMCVLNEAFSKGCFSSWVKTWARRLGVKL